MKNIHRTYIEILVYPYAFLIRNFLLFWRNYPSPKKLKIFVILDSEFSGKVRWECENIFIVEFNTQSDMSFLFENLGWKVIKTSKLKPSSLPREESSHYSKVNVCFRAALKSRVLLLLLLVAEQSLCFVAKTDEKTVKKVMAPQSSRAATDKIEPLFFSSEASSFFSSFEKCTKSHVSWVLLTDL